MVELLFRLGVSAVKLGEMSTCQPHAVVLGILRCSLFDHGTNPFNHDDRAVNEPKVVQVANRVRRTGPFLLDERFHLIEPPLPVE